MSRSNKSPARLLSTRSQCSLPTSAHEDRHFYHFYLLFMNKISELAKSLGHYSINSGRAVMSATAKCITAGRSLASLFSIQPDCIFGLDVWIPIQGEQSLSAYNCFAGFAKFLYDRDQSYLWLQLSLAMQLHCVSSYKFFEAKQNPDGNIVSGETCTSKASMLIINQTLWCWMLHLSIATPCSYTEYTEQNL